MVAWDSIIGKEYYCGRTKTTAKNKCIGRWVYKEPKSAMQTQTFSVIFDASNNQDVDKMFLTPIQKLSKVLIG